MPDPQLLGRARVRAVLTAGWVSGLDDLPDAVLGFVAEDMPWLLKVARDAVRESAAGTTSPTDRILQAVAVHHRLKHLVGKVRLADSAQDIPGLWETCEADVAAALDDLCRHRQRALLEIAVRELAGTGWTGDELTDEGVTPC